MYQSVWLAVVGEQLACAREPTNTSDVHAVAVLKSGTIYYWSLTKEDIDTMLNFSEERWKHSLCSDWKKSLLI